ncbi:MAG: TauD/TfdA family dioxygenase [Actinomycetes bacterium]
MTAMTLRPLSDTVGVEVVGVDRDALVHDPDLPDRLLAGLAAHGVLVFRGFGHDDDLQIAFSRRLGEVETFSHCDPPEIFRVTLDPARNPSADYLRGTVDWHIDGMTEDVPIMATLLCAHEVAVDGGETQFVSTYVAYEELPGDVRDRVDGLRVVHTFLAAQRLIHPDATEEQLAFWAQRPAKEHPLVWRHRDGRRSLVLSATADHVVGLDPADGRALLAELLERATSPGRVLTHAWEVGDLVMWDNRGLLHRVLPYAWGSPRDMHRTTIKGDEPIA